MDSLPNQKEIASRYEQFIKRMEQYEDLFEKLLGELKPVKKSQFPSWLQHTLDNFITVFTGQVVYTYHEVTLDRVRVLLAGPTDYLRRRIGEDEVSREKGYIGKTLNSPVLFRIFDQVDEKDGFLRANPSTKSEMVIKIIRPITAETIAVLNLESSEEYDFTTLDGVAFSLIASLQLNSMILSNSIKEKISIIRGISDTFQKIRDYPSNDGHVASYADILRTFLPYNAFCIASLQPQISEINEDKTNPINVDYCEGYDSPKIYKANGGEVGYFLHNVLVSGEAHEESIDELDKFKFKEFRKRTGYALGACFPKTDRGCGYPVQGAVVVEFDEEPLHIESPSESLQELSELYGQIRQMSNQFTEWNNLNRAVSSLAKYGPIQNYDTSAREFLTEIADELSTSLCADKCMFFEILSDEQAPTLRVIASSQKFIPGNNVFWNNTINELFGSKIEMHLKRRDDYRQIKIYEPSANSEISSYDVFATRLHSRLNSKNILFVLININKDADSPKSQLPKIIRSFLGLQLQSISSILERKQLTGSTNMLKNSMRTTIGLLFDEVKNNSESPNDAEQAIYDKVHYLLENWVGVIGTPYAAIYSFNAEKDTLEMTESTYNYIKNKFQKAKNKKPKFPDQRLILDVNPQSEMYQKGLTSTIWNGRKNSLVSVDVVENGSKECIKWWDEAVGAPAKCRYFAGAKIFDHQNSRAHGVLTINGNKPSNFIARELEAEWEILPLLEVLSEEIGKYLGKLRAKDPKKDTIS